MNIKKNYLTKNRCYQSGQKRTAIGIQIHSIGTGQNTAQAVADYWNQSGVSACVHYIVDAETAGLVLQTLPEDVKAWADAGWGNKNLITIEMCESDYIKYTGNGADYRITDEAKFKADILRSYKTTVELCADICKRYGWSPEKKLSNGMYLISSHNEGRIAGLSSSHVDPDHVWGKFGLTMSKFRADVKAAMGGKAVDVEPKWYRVRLSWKDEKSQVGAYEKLENAKKNCPAGYTVYDHSGKAVYHNEAKGTQAKSLNGMSEAEKIKFMAPLYKAVADKTGMLASVGLAQFCLESGYGTTDLAQNANNLHGMKCSLSGNTWGGSSWDGVSSYRKKTAEQDKAGNEYFVNADFRKYPCMEDSIADRAAYYLGAMNGSKRRYDGIENLKTAEEQVKAIKAGGYATDVKYVSKLMNIIDRFNLTQYDDHEKAPKEKETAPASNPEDIYVVRKSLKDVKSQLGAYHVLNNAKNKASENYGYKVFDLTTGKAVFEPTWTKAQLYIAAAKRMDEIMRQDIKDGLKWVYINNKPRANTFNEARIQGKRYTNCCTGALWAAQEADLVPLKAVQWFGDHQNIVFINGNSGKKEAEKYFEFIKVGNKTVKQCVKDGTVKPGDILMYKDLTHTNAYLGDNVSFDTGHATCSAKGENAPFKCWVAPLTYLDFVVMWIARLRENVKYRVRIGIFQDPSNIKRNDAKLEKAEMCPYHKQTANGTAIYSGAFDQSSKAEKRLKEIKALGYNGAVIEVS